MPVENTTGNARPADADKVIGISMAKNSAPLYGQNANANTTPSKKEPSNP